MESKVLSGAVVGTRCYGDLNLRRDPVPLVSGAFPLSLVLMTSQDLSKDPAVIHWSAAVKPGVESWFDFEVPARRENIPPFPGAVAARNLPV